MDVVGMAGPAGRVRTRKVAARRVSVLVVSLLAALTAVIPAMPTAAAVAANGPATPAAAVSGPLAGIAATSASNAWAVGNYSVYQGNAPVSKTLIMHWNGQAWTQVPSPSPSARGSGLVAVAPTS